ncbi:MAG TPA: CNP1-like family protein [Burkholderiales bacterium]|nr:CNP1-like family protein [Burkholderiales bacterium]
MKDDIGGVLEEKKFKESDVTLPPYPDAARFIEFKPRRNSSNHFFIDRESVSLAEDRVVRYSVVVKSESGATTTSYEGLRCKTAEYKVYAFGLQGNQWTPTADPQWRPILRLTPDFRFALYKDYFCDVASVAGRNAEDLVANVVGNPLNNVSDKNR